MKIAKVMLIAAASAALALWLKDHVKITITCDEPCCDGTCDCHCDEQGETCCEPCAEEEPDCAEA